jgi:hypothetical protein
VLGWRAQKHRPSVTHSSPERCEPQAKALKDVKRIVPVNLDRAFHASAPHIKGSKAYVDAVGEFMDPKKDADADAKTCQDVNFKARPLFARCSRPATFPCPR